MEIVKSLLEGVVQLAILLVLARVLYSMFVNFGQGGGEGSGPAGKILVELTDPILAPFEVITRGFASKTGLDFSPLLAILALQFIQSILAGL